MRVEASRNAGADTWHLVVHVPGKPDIVCPNAPWALVESTTALSSRAPVTRPGPIANAVGWAVAPMLMLVCNPWFWLCVALGGGLHTCGS